MPNGVRKTAGNALKIGEHAVAPLGMQPAQRIGKKAVVVDLGIPTIIHEL